ASASGSENTATVAMPSRCAVRMTRAAISPRLATSSLSIIRSHPEDAEATAAGDGLGVDGRERHAQHGAGVARVDDPVVVEPCGDGERVRLLLDLRLDGGGALAVRLLVERLALALRRRPAHDREHAGELGRPHHGELRAGPG